MTLHHSVRATTIIPSTFSDTINSEKYTEKIRNQFFENISNEKKACGFLQQ
jgi:hypothetical protein